MIADIHIINETTSLRNALAALNTLSGGEMTLLVVDTDGVMIGTLTDGDVRRALLDGVSLDAAVVQSMHRSFKAIRPGDDALTVMRQCRTAGIVLLPRLDEKGHIVEVLNLNRTYTRLPLSAILMAGGRGERLRPLTDSCPKPLLEIDGKPIIDYNIEALAKCGVQEITVTTRYLADMIRAHFNSPIYGVKVECVEETEPLGTIGAVSLVKNHHEEATILMNSDLLTTISFEDMYMHHRTHSADITIAAIPYVVSVPYAILSTNGSEVTAIEEKPTYTHYANAGIYIINSTLLSKIPSGLRLDAPDFIETMMSEGRRITYYPISGTWIDIGSPADFRQAQEIMRHHRHLSH
jgi:dTDP-glucose pyrophosphorylase